MKIRSMIPMIVTPLFALCGCVLRLWSLSVSDGHGLPADHIANTVFAWVSLALILILLVLSTRSPGRCGNHRILRCGSGGYILSLLAAVGILAGTCLEFAETLRGGPTASSPIMCLLGLVGALCCMYAAHCRKGGEPAHPAVEIMPVVYLVVKLILNFNNWSIDPIILDYCVILFALIFSLLAFYGGAGFVFDKGKPRTTLFYAMASVYFCAAALMDGIADRSAATIVTYLGLLLWQLPVIICLSLPAEPDPEETPQDEHPRSEAKD